MIDSHLISWVALLIVLVVMLYVAYVIYGHKERRPNQPVTPQLQFIPGDEVLVINSTLPRKKWTAGRVQHVRLSMSPVGYQYMVRGVYFNANQLEGVQ